MFLWVPLAGWLATGRAKGAWEYSRTWLRSIGIILVLAGVMALIVLPFMP